MDKLVYKDGEYLKVLRGKFLSEDDFFLEFGCDDSVYRINKKDIVSIRKDKEGAENGRSK